MQLILIQAPCWSVAGPPYNLALLKAACQERGHKVICLDFNIKFYNYLTEKDKHGLYDKPADWFNDSFARQIINTHSAFIDECVHETMGINCRVIGFTITGLNRLFAEEIIRRIKLIDKDKIIILGGAHCFKSEIGKVLLHCNPDIDAICYLEGEKVLPHFLETIEKNGRVGDCPGTAFRNEVNEIVDCPEMPLVEELDSLPFADFSDFNLDSYIFNLDAKAMKELPISTSRGCINKCIFCSESNNWKRYRCRSAQNVFDEIVYQLHKYPAISSFSFNDSLLNGNLEMLEELCGLIIKNKINITWGGQATLREGMTKSLIFKMSAAGCIHLIYGLESASPKILKMIGKKFTPELAERVIRDTYEAGIKADVTLIVGFPTETDDDRIITGEFLRRNRDFINEKLIHLLVLARGTYIYENRDYFGIELEDNFNSVRWHSNKENNTLEGRLEILEMYNNFIDRGGADFYSAADYYLFAAGKCFDKKDYKNALQHCLKAKKVNLNALKDKYINDKIVSIQKYLQE